MITKPMRGLAIILVILVCTAGNGSGIIEAAADIHFTEDFEKGTAKWELVNPHRVKTVDSGDPEHGRVLAIRSGGEGVHALIKNSRNWTDIRFEGDVYFPFFQDHCLQFVYNYNVFENRVDFGSIFLYGPYGADFKTLLKNAAKYAQFPPDKFLGNAVYVSPHRDGKLSGGLYPEYWVVLTGEPAVEPGEWGHFKAEVMGPVCHFYVTDMKTPKLTFEFHEYSSGMVGFNGRILGKEYWVDNITVTSINEFCYKGPPLPAGRNYKPGKLITKWDIIGPFSKRMKEIEGTDGFIPGKVYGCDGKEHKWKPFETDARGCVLAGKVVERFSARFFTYLHTELYSQEKKEVALRFSSAAGLVLWLNNKEIGPVKPFFTAWYDFWKNPEHAGTTKKVTLEPGKNHIVLLLRGDSFRADGFFAYCDMDDNKDEK